jgi:Arylsulfotransferase (ASST)
MNRFRRAAAFVPLLAVLGAAANTSAPASAATPIISPLPGTPTAMPQTQISFLGASASSLHSITVTGSRSGRHTGRLRSYVASTGASFIPARAFTPGETVKVSARWSTGHSTRTLRTNFTVAVPVPGLTQAFPVTPGTPADQQSFKSEPALHPPTIQINQAASSQSAPGYVFAAPFQGPAQWGPMILDNAGHVVWFRPVPAGQDAADFRTQTYRGHTDLTWWQGHTVILGYGLGENIIADSHYRTVAVVRAGNGMATDEHEFTILPNGAAIVIAFQPVRWNLSSVGGPAQGQAVDTAVEEIDIRTGLVMWEWRSLGHVEVNQSYSKPPTTSGGFYDYFHLNSAEVLPGGKILISARSTSAIYELSQSNGQILWQLGGKSSTFSLGPGVAFADQHNAMMLPTGEISLFDDEGAPPVNPPSRGEIVKIDAQAKTATLVQQFVHTPPLATGSQGNVQQLAGGKYMVGWGGLPNFTEFDSEGHQLFDGTFPKGEFSYRVYRLPWSGTPLTAPALVVKHTTASCGPGATPGAVPPCLPSATLTAYASWNGATGLARWKLLAGTSAKRLHTVATVASSGFETAIPAPAAKVYEVRALSSSGRTLASSKVTAASG